MASELRVSTLKDASGNNSVATSVVFNGTSKAWVNFNGSGTLAVRDSYNHSSVTDNGTGHYFPNLTNAMSATGFCTSAMSEDGGVGDFIAYDSGTSQTTTQIRIYNFTSGSSIADSAEVCVDYNGDLA